MTQLTVQPVSSVLQPSSSSNETLESILHGSPYQSYVYSYPHKTAYRTFDQPIPLQEAWECEDRSSLFLYIHIPFCEMRCGFCNLFTSVKPGGDVVEEYIDALERQLRITHAQLGARSFARMAIGGGTPTYLSVPLFERVLDLVEDVLGADLHTIPVSVECSPKTASLEHLTLLRTRGVDRISMGVQSFIPEETQAIHRPQHIPTVLGAIERMNALSFPTVNLDLMYGLPDQTPTSWETSLRETLRHKPAEIFLYPLYVRPLTRLGTNAQAWDDQRTQLYRLGRDLLLSEGYTQLSMRLFRRINPDTPPAPVYTCQDDGMVGLGCGARSYTQTLHYASSYAVGPKRVKGIIQDYIRASDHDHAHIPYGFQLSLPEQKTRFLILSLLHQTGLSLNHYTHRFHTDPRDDFPLLTSLQEHALVQLDPQRSVLHLTPQGFERSDAIGPNLFTDHVQHLMKNYDAQ